MSAKCHRISSTEYPRSIVYTARLTPASLRVDIHIGHGLAIRFPVNLETTTVAPLGSVQHFVRALNSACAPHLGPFGAKLRTTPDRTMTAPMGCLKCRDLAATLSASRIQFNTALHTATRKRVQGKVYRLPNSNA